MQNCLYSPSSLPTFTLVLWGTICVKDVKNFYLTNSVFMADGTLNYSFSKAHPIPFIKNTYKELKHTHTKYLKAIFNGRKLGS